MNGLDRLAYHAALIQLVQATREYVALVDRVGALAKVADPDGAAPTQPEEQAAVDAVKTLLRDVAARNPGMAELFAVASGGLAIPA
jgi:hypothetical protein